MGASVRRLSPVVNSAEEIVLEANDGEGEREGTGDAVPETTTEEERGERIEPET